MITCSGLFYFPHFSLCDLVVFLLEEDSLFLSCCGMLFMKPTLIIYSTSPTVAEVRTLLLDGLLYRFPVRAQAQKQAPNTKYEQPKSQALYDYTALS